MRRAAVALVVAVAAGLLPAQLIARPRARPPAPPTTPAPPPVWIDTRAGDYWLAYGAYCWGRRATRAACFDPLPPEARKDLPRIVLRRGEVVRFHLGSRPRELGLAVGKQLYTLARVSAPRWRVVGRGGIALLYTKRASTVSYHARLVIRPAR